MITIETILDTTLEQIKSANRLVDCYLQNKEFNFLYESGKKIKVIKYDLNLLEKYSLDEKQEKVKKILKIKYENLIDKYFQSIK